MRASSKETIRPDRRSARPILAGLAATAMAIGTLVAASAAGADSAASETAFRRGSESAASVVTGATFVPVTPYRAYDSRFPGNCNDIQGPFGPIDGATVDVVADRNDGCNQKIPSQDLVAVTYNLTVVNTIGSGFLSVIPVGAATGGTSAVNWTESGQIVPNGGVVGVGRAFEENGFIHVETGPTGSTNFFIDITGYYSM